MDPNRDSDNFEHGDSYERYMGRWSRLVAPPFLEWLNEPKGRIWLDVGCGTGALCAAILEGCAPGAITGVEQSEGFLEVARKNLGTRADFLEGDAIALPIKDKTVEVTVSALMLNFAPDPAAALLEMKRVTKSGGTIAAYVWDYAEGMEMIRIFWDVAIGLDPLSAKLDEAARFPLCRPKILEHLFKEAELSRIEMSPIHVTTRFANFEDYWQPFLGGQGPAPSYVASRSEAERTRLRETLRERLPAGADGSIDLTALAWAIRGAVHV